MKTAVFFSLFALISILLSLLCIVFMCIWIYRDAKGRGQSGWVWIMIVAAASPIIGLLAYFLAGRKERRIPCQNCSWMISQDARFCERCGVEQEPVSIQPVEKKSGTAKFMAASIACFVMAILCVFGMAVIGIVGGLPSRADYPSPAINVISTNIMFDGEWKVNCYYCSDGYLKKDFTLSSPQEILCSNITCEEGEIILHIQQGEKKVQYDVTDIQGEFQLPLENFQPGKIRVMIEVRGIKRLKSTIMLV